MNHSIKRLHLLTLNVGFAHHEADWNWKSVQSPFNRLYLVTEGDAYVQIGTKEIHLTPEHLYLIPAYMTHSYKCIGHFCLYYVHIYEDNEANQSIMENYEFPYEIKADKHSEEMMKRLCYIYPFLKLPESNPDSYNNYKSMVNSIQKNNECSMCDNIEAQGILLILISHFFFQAHQKNDVKNDYIAQTLHFIRQKINKKIDIQELADKACMSKDYYIRLFKQQVGSTPNAYITTKKIEKAELLLVTTNKPINTLAYNLGYDNCSYFIRTFKKITGYTPLQYRQMK